jgi:hypothetical protein
MFLEEFSSGTFKVKGLERQINYKSLGARKPNGLKRIVKFR